MSETSNLSAYEALFTTVGRGILVAIKPDGRPHLSNVVHHYDPSTQTLRVSITDGRAKTKNMRRDPRVSLYVPGDNFWQFAVVEGTAELTPVAADPQDDTVEQLIAYYRAGNGEHPDWDDYRAAMVADGRLITAIHPERAYGLVAG